MLISYRSLLSFCIILIIILTNQYYLYGIIIFLLFNKYLKFTFLGILCGLYLKRYIVILGKVFYCIGCVGYVNNNYVLIESKIGNFFCRTKEQLNYNDTIKCLIYNKNHFYKIIKIYNIKSDNNIGFIAKFRQYLNHRVSDEQYRYFFKAILLL